MRICSLVNGDPGFNRPDYSSKMELTNQRKATGRGRLQLSSKAGNYHTPGVGAPHLLRNHTRLRPRKRLLASCSTLRLRNTRRVGQDSLSWRSAQLTACKPDY